MCKYLSIFIIYFFALQCWKFHEESAWYSWKWQLSTILIHSATQDKMHFSASWCHVLLTHWRPYCTEMWLCWWTDKCWWCDSVQLQSNADQHLYAHPDPAASQTLSFTSIFIHARLLSPCNTISSETVMCVSFHQSLLDDWVNLVCLICSHDVSLQVCVWMLIHNMTKEF